MKCFVVLFCVIALTELANAETWMKNVEECKTKTGGSIDYIKNIDFAVPSTKENSCFLACVKKASGMFDENNKLNMEAIKIYFTNDKTLKNNKVLADKFIELFQLCADNQNDEGDECVAAQQLAECVVPKKIEILKQMHLTIDDLKN